MDSLDYLYFIIQHSTAQLYNIWLKTDIASKEEKCSNADFLPNISSLGFKQRGKQLQVISTGQITMGNQELCYILETVNIA